MNANYMQGILLHAENTTVNMTGTIFTLLELSVLILKIYSNRFTTAVWPSTSYLNSQCLIFSDQDHINFWSCPLYHKQMWPLKAVLLRSKNFMPYVRRLIKCLSYIKTKWIFPKVHLWSLSYHLRFYYPEWI